MFNIVHIPTCSKILRMRGDIPVRLATYMECERWVKAHIGAHPFCETDCISPEGEKLYLYLHMRIHELAFVECSDV